MKLIILALVTTLASAKIHIQGHRGARAVLPENTLAGFQYAIGLGVEVIELDIAITSDRQVVISHDPVINTTLCQFDREKTPIYSLTLKEVQQIDCGSKKNPRFPRQKPIPGAKIPTLAELFELVKKSKSPAAQTVKFNIEIKMFPQYPSITPPPKEFAQLVYNVIKKYRMEKRSIVQSFDHRPIKAIKKLDPQLSIAFLNYQSLPDFVAIAQGLGVDYISPNQFWITKDQIQALHKIGVKTVPWTANTIKEWERLVQLGVDGIITDDPAGLIDYLQQKGLR